MSFLDTIKSIVNPVQMAVEGFQAVYNTIRGKLPPEEQAKTDLAVMQIQLQTAQAEREQERELEKIYAADLASLREQVKVEIQSEDKFVSRARYAWFWGLLFVYAANYGLPALINPFLIIGGKTSIIPADFPADLHALAGGLLLGLGYMRTLDKKWANGSTKKP